MHVDLMHLHIRLDIEMTPVYGDELFTPWLLELDWGCEMPLTLYTHMHQVVKAQKQQGRKA